MNNIKKTLLICLIFFSLNSFCQDLKCKDFHNGTFNITVTEPVESKWKIIRKGNKQTEIIDEKQIPEELKGTDYPTTQY